MAKPLQDIISDLRQEETRWDAILELKLLTNDSYVEPLINLLNDDNWVIRWCVAEKLGEMGDVRAIEPLIELLKDPDFHVKKNAAKSLERFGQKSVPALASLLDNLENEIRKQARDILLAQGKKSLKQMEIEMYRHDWVAGNQLLYCIWKIGQIDAEEILIHALKSPDLRRNSIVFLGLMRSKKALPKIIKLYQYSKLKRDVLNMLSRYSKDEVFPLVKIGRAHV